MSETQTVALENSPFSVGSLSQFTINDLVSGTNYRLHVQAENEFGMGPMSNLLCAVTMDDVPDAPINL